MSEELKILEIRMLNGGRSLKAFVDIQIGDWIIREFRIVKHNGQKASVLPPQISWKDAGTGEIKYKGVFTIPSEDKQRIDVAVLSAFQKELERDNENRSIK